MDGYFVHFIAPKDVRVGDKAILFILDVSGSMSGRKISQVHEAMDVILDQLRPGDYFNMLKFSSGTRKLRIATQIKTKSLFTLGVSIDFRVDPSVDA